MRNAFIATFNEKRRQPSFLIICVLLALSVVFIFPKNTGIMRPLIINPSTFQQATNATWVPMSVSFIMGLLLPLVGIVFLHDTLSIDDKYGVKEIFLTSKTSSAKWIFVKFLCNVTFFLIFLVVVLGFSLIAAILKFGIRTVDFEQFVIPFIILVPGLVFVSALSLFLEVIPILTSWVRITSQMFLVVLLFVSGTMYNQSPNEVQRIFNISGSQYLIDNVNSSMMSEFDESIVELKVIGSTATQYTGTKNLVFLSIHLNVTDLANMAILILLSLVLVLASSLLVKSMKINHKAKPFKVNTVKSNWFLTQLHIMMGNLSKKWVYLLLLLWAISWLSNFSQVSQMLFPVSILLITPLLTEICTVRQQSGVDQLLIITRMARKKAVFIELCVCMNLTVFTVLPLAFKTSKLISLFLIIWAIQLAALNEMMCLYTNSQYPAQFLISIFIFLYLNGAPVLPLDVNVVSIGIFYLVILILSVLLIYIYIFRELRH